MLTGIHVVYALATPPGTRETVERALSRHASKCPTAMTLRGAVEVTWEARVEEGGEVWEARGSRDG